MSRNFGRLIVVFFVGDRSHILKAIVAVIDKSANASEEAKLVEQGMSMLANISAFDILAKKVGNFMISFNL